MALHTEVLTLLGHHKVAEQREAEVLPSCDQTDKPAEIWVILKKIKLKLKPQRAEG